MLTTMGITQNQLKAIQSRLNKSEQEKDPDHALGSEKSAPIIAPNAVLLGVDPSLRGTGFGIIQLHDNTISPVDFGVIKCSKSWSRTKCLGNIQEKIRSLIDNVRPDICIFEGLFYTQNLKTAIIMGEARGASLAVAGSFNIPCYEIAPRKIKQAIVGFGGAQKLAVAKMVQRILQLQSEPQSDAADALAAAIAFAQEYRGTVIDPPKPL